MSGEANYCSFLQAAADLPAQQALPSLAAPPAQALASLAEQDFFTMPSEAPAPAVADLGATLTKALEASSN
jgi:hypothetical protein